MMIIVYRTYALMVLLFFIVSVSNNYVFSYNISVPLHIIFRSVCISAKCCLLRV